MNKNLQLVEKSLDTINPGWNVTLVASFTEDGFEYDLFTKEPEEEFMAFLALVSSVTLQELEERT